MSGRKSLKFLSMLLFACAVASASVWAGYEIKEMTPEVTKAISNRQARFSQIESAKSSGHLGENNRGYVEYLKGETSIKTLASNENADRQMIYRTISEQNQLGDSGFSIVETVFAEVQREKANAGVRIQNPDGQWVKK